LSGDWLTLGAVAALAVAGAVRQQGSRNETSSALTLNRAGFPWPIDYEIFHATTGLRAIRRGGFKVRRQGLASAVGGGPDKSVSFTLDPRVADSILVGLFTLRAGARGELGLGDLWKKFRSEAPGAIRTYKEWSERSYHRSPDEFRFLDEGYLRVEASFGGIPPPGAVPIDNGWQGSNGWYHLRWWQMPVTAAEKAKARIKRIEAFSDLYKTLLATGEDVHECTNPLFWNPDMEALAELSDVDLGFISARSTIPRVCLDAMGSIQTGYLEPSVARLWSGILSRYNRDCSQPLEWDRYEGESMLYNAPSNERIGDFAIVDEGKLGPSATMSYHWVMAELRVYDVKQIELVSFTDGRTRLEKRGLWGRATCPWFDGKDIESVRPMLPGQVLLDRGRRARRSGRKS